MQTLPIQLFAGYAFSRPVSVAVAPEGFRWWSGVYVVGRVQEAGLSVLDVGESADIGDRISSHDRRGCWTRHAFGLPLVVMAHLEQDLATRLRIEVDLRSRLTPPCGIR